METNRRPPLTDFSEGGQSLPAGHRGAGARHAVTLAVDLGQRDHRLRSDTRDVKKCQPVTRYVVVG